MNSEDRTTILPAVGPSGGRAERRAAEARGRRRGHRSRRRGGIGPLTVVVAAVAGTGVIGALAGAGFAVYGGAENTSDQSAVAFEPQIAAEAGTHEGIQVPGASGGDPSALAAAAGSAAASPPATDLAQAAPAPTSASATTPTATGTTAGPSTPAASPSATAKPTSSPSPTGSARPTTATKSASSGATTTAATPPKPATTPASGTAAQYAQQVVDLVNAQRAQHGCGPVTAEPRLAAAAQSHSEDMADRSYFDHASPEGYHADHRIEANGYRWSTWGENIARGQKDPAAVMDAWMNSPGHRANILNCAFKELGVGVRTGSGGPWWTQVFAAPA
ncbi:CAP domain-containing protein [Kitasatospora sp. NPDC058170]|uniref:CAP domain-containing protein n=1 Tax=Kitasatospora sp. NPDC058170 TaxID=3346364 RepID=UPI0036DBC841